MAYPNKTFISIPKRDEFAWFNSISVKKERSIIDKNPSFNWAIYADATFAALSVLIPIPFLDSILERYFRHRIIKSIATRHGQRVHPQALKAVNRPPRAIWVRLRGILLFPFRFTIELILRFSRKILYFLTVKRTVEALSTYWQRAYLLDYMVRQGYLEDEVLLETAIKALEQTLDGRNGGTLNRLARRLVRSPFQLILSVYRAWQGEEDDAMVRVRRVMSDAWVKYHIYFQALQEQYELTYQIHNAKAQYRIKKEVKSESEKSL